jgi:hypothetical protein
MQASINRPRDLQAAYPYQFAKATSRGSVRVRSRLAADHRWRMRPDRRAGQRRQVPAQVPLDQIKEKFGTLRLYWGARAMRGMHIDVLTPTGVASLIPKPHGKGRDAAVATRIAQIVDEAEQRSAHACIVCGAPGGVRPGGWVLTLCDAHAAQRERGDELVYWFED